MCAIALNSYQFQLQIKQSIIPFQNVGNNVFRTGGAYFNNNPIIIKIMSIPLVPFQYTQLYNTFGHQTK